MGSLFKMGRANGLMAVPKDYFERFTKRSGAAEGGALRIFFFRVRGLSSASTRDLLQQDNYKSSC